MSSASVLFYIWAFIKEIFSSSRIEDPYKGSKKSGSIDEHAVAKVISTIQSSRRTIASIILILAVSLFINYKFIKKITAITRDESVDTYTTAPTHNPAIDRPTVPKPYKRDPHEDSEAEDVVKYLEDLYGVRK